MSYKQPGRASIVSRAIAAIILTGIYSFALIGATAVVFGVSSTSAQAQRGDGRGRGDRGRGRGRARGDRGRGRGDRGRGRGRGRGGCLINAAGVRICL
ncbi:MULTISPECIES: hypothetical protein [Rhodopseudomonas]|uniref:hypothetical protein n=1 Tax=Rhodopseudomonas TaxID=1073 RepID=UPI0009BA0A2C|nr:MULTISPECIES: hypothetical protein [Rhodopseudomonas]MDF3810186.1 hypothetical protein [Rhodopseudomonas sp. BAL398]WOK20171.1 hypothetical protein RBJ75_11925 [Rhodopseudomonas sp. BAL398]